jgi:hypothetical protein
MLVILLKIVGALVALVVAFAVWRIVATVRAQSRLHGRLFDEVAPTVLAIQRGEAPEPAVLERLAASPRTRTTLFEVLEAAGRPELFPAAWRTPHALAEGRLVTWLMHPNELQAEPAEIALGAEVALPDRADDAERWLVYRFRTEPPHWAAKDGWLAGVVGPVDPANPAPTPGDPKVVFSQLPAYDSATPEQHATAMRDLMRLKGVEV